MKEQKYDQLLGIETTGTQEWSLHLAQNHPYEATPYQALDVLFHEYEWTDKDHFVDFGCGKGRFLFYLHHRSGLSGTGIEVNKKRCEEAESNLLRYRERNSGKPDSIQFKCCPAEAYEVDSQDNRFYFFNPFAVPIFKKVVRQILASAKQHPRSVDLILYYPSTDYLQFLDIHTSFEIWKEVKIPRWYERNKNERFVIYQFHR
ncbi:class I SAM-dependent methyltransferase [Lederbergia sp. NSJ-179]|uniref:class I SAM-dependent methyltransferase n=1 Tax=Lederbergia sp. NSJ-179 TaxID=2931402 RepID=UPI001FD4B0ED|nr:class I SAM-dependent methyltransferase [Lederbergia sp. NSJ-179]MCJ7843140.1 class I SAM-dependent methyltransferase [Lederbergia sp. NSJ-179]